MNSIERHPLEPFLPERAQVLFLGSFPPPRKRWSMDFFYPNFINDHWRIEGQLFFNDRNHFVLPGRKAFDREAVVTFCQQKGIAFYDTATAVRRLRDNASDEFLEVVEATDIRQLLRQLPLCRAIVTTGKKATETVCASLGIPEVPKVNASVPIPALDLVSPPPALAPVSHSPAQDAQPRRLVLYRLPSSSRAYPLPFDKKVAAYRSLFQSVGLL